MQDGEVYINCFDEISTPFLAVSGNYFCTEKENASGAR
jgi:hypothetical protein